MVSGGMPDDERTSSEGASGLEGDKSESQGDDRLFCGLEEDLSESLGTNIPTDMTMTTTMAEPSYEDEDEEEDTDENQNKIIRRRLPPRTTVVNTRPRPVRSSRPSASGTTTFRTSATTAQSDRLVTKELIEKKQLEHDVQLLKIELSQKSLLLENTKADFMGKLDDLEEKLSDAQHQKEILQAKLETQLAVEAEEHRRLQERTKSEIKIVLRAQEALEASNEELRIKAGNLQRSLTKDLFISDKKYSELRKREESSLAIKDLVAMRVFEVVEPLRDQVETGKADNRFLSESKAAALKELAQVKDELAKQIGEKNRLVKSDQEKARGLKDAEEQIKKKEFKKDHYDLVAEERDNLKTRHEDLRKRNEFLEIEVKKMAKEITDFSRENNSLSQSNTLLAQDKEYHVKQIRDLSGRCEFSEEKLRKTSEELDKAKDGRELMYEKYVLSREQIKTQYEEKLQNELESLKLRTSHEIDRVRASVRELYERENQTFRESREMALSEKEEAVAGNKRLADKVTLLQEESKNARVDADSRASDAVNALRMKTFELESLQALYEQALHSQKDLQAENCKLSGKLERLTKEHFEVKSALERINAELTMEAKSLKDKLKIYENLEKEMDEVVMQCAEMDDETQAEKVLFAYGYGANVPSTAKRRMMQSVHLARRVLALERANVSQRRQIEAAEASAKTMAEELANSNKLIEDAQQPYGYILQTVKIKDEEIKNLKAHIEVQSSDLKRLSKERDRLQKIQAEMSADLERLLNNRQEMALVKRLLSAAVKDTPPGLSKGGRRLDGGGKELDDENVIVMNDDANGTQQQQQQQQHDVNGRKPVVPFLSSKAGNGDGPKSEENFSGKLDAIFADGNPDAPKPTIFTRPKTIC